MDKYWWEVCYERGAFAVPGAVAPELEAQDLRAIDAEELITLGKFEEEEHGETEANRLAHLCASNALRAMGATHGDPNANTERVAAYEECSKCGAQIDTAKPHARISVNLYAGRENDEIETLSGWFAARFCGACGDVIEARARALAAFAADTHSEGQKQ